MSVAVVIQNAKHVLFSSVACLAAPYLAALSYKEYKCRKILMEFKMRVLFSLQLLSALFRILRRIQRDIVTNKLKSSGKVTFYRKLNFTDRFSQTVQI